MKPPAKLTAKLEVDLSALRRNVRFAMKACGKKSFIYPVVKSNAYGLGVQRVVSLLIKEGMNTFCVLNIEEAQFLSSRFKNINSLILGPLLKAELKEVSQNKNWIPVIGSMKELHDFVKICKKTHPFHIKINTGMSRFGFDKEEGPELLSFLKRHPMSKLKGLCGHLPGYLGSGADLNQPQSPTQKEISSFRETVNLFSKNFKHLKNHLFNSVTFLSCLMEGQEPEWGLRLGGLLYGIQPEEWTQSAKFQKLWKQRGFQPVSSLKSFICAVRRVKKGGRVSYGGVFRAKRASTIAVVSMGYADGLPRFVSEKKTMRVLFRGRLVPLSGRVCMNFFMVDLTGFKDIKIGEEIVIYGRQKNKVIAIESLAKTMGTIPYEIMTQTAPLAPRVYK